MTDTALKNTFFGANSASSVNPALKSLKSLKTESLANAQKTASPSQDFGAVLDKTAQKYEQKSKEPAQAVSDQTQQPQEETVEAESGGAVEDTDAEAAEVLESEKACDTQETGEEPAAVTDEEPAGESVRNGDPVDEMTADEIANALEQIIGQLKEILGITEEELLAGMDTLGMQFYDLLDTDNMAQLVAAISGKDSAISLVADEKLYTALQEITEAVDTQVENLLADTGLTGEELDAVLQKLQEMQNQKPGQLPQGPELELEPELEQTITEALPFESEETAQEPVADGNQTAVKEPVIIREDNTKVEEQPAKQYDTLPENQQENPAQIGAKPQTQETGKDTKGSGSGDKDSRNYGQNSTAQNFQNHLSEVGDTAVAEGVAKFTSESTENILRQLADMVRIVKNENLTEMELQLHPASLGTVNVSLTTKGGMVTAEFTTQNEAVKAAIEAQATQLRANLEEQGVKVEAIEVSVESHQMEHELDKNGDRQQKQSQEQETMRIQGMRRGRSSINLRAFADGEELEDGMQRADDATRIAMEIMAANGNTMDLLA